MGLLCFGEAICRGFSHDWLFFFFFCQRDVINTVEPYELTLALVLFDINLSVYLKKTKRKKRNGFCKLRKCAEENNDVGKEKYAVISSLIKPQKKMWREKKTEHEHRVSPSHCLGQEILWKMCPRTKSYKR